MRSQYRLGIDAGGTFTDFVLAEKSGETRLYKALSTPGDPTLAIKNGLDLVAEDTGKSIREIVSQCDLCINGTTVGLNALIQHKGAKVGLIATAGHEDSIEIRNGHKEDGYRYDAELSTSCHACATLPALRGTGACVVYWRSQDADERTGCA